MFIEEPERGASEGSSNMEATSYWEDVKDICRNKSFMLTTAGFTCVAFVAGALSWFGPKVMYLGLKLHPGNQDIKLSEWVFYCFVTFQISSLPSDDNASIVPVLFRLLITFENIQHLVNVRNRGDDCRPDWSSIRLLSRTTSTSNRFAMWSTYLRIWADHISTLCLLGPCLCSLQYSLVLHFRIFRATISEHVLEHHSRHCFGKIINNLRLSWDRRCS